MNFFRIYLYYFLEKNKKKLVEKEKKTTVTLSKYLRIYIELRNKI